MFGKNGTSLELLMLYGITYFYWLVNLNLTGWFMVELRIE